jgi:GNAT superfamily N-acetyltransferase
MTRAPGPADLDAALAATWPPRSVLRRGPWRLCDGAGGGKRVSAATAVDAVGPSDLPALAAWAAERGERPLVRVRAGEAALDALLAGRGFARVDPTLIYLAPLAALADPPPPVTAFAHWPPLAITAALWDAGGIGPERRAVMARAGGPKAAVLGRTDDAPAGAAFVALAGDIAMLHALWVAPRFRRRGTARNILKAAAVWAQDRGAAWFALAVLERNGAARALCASLKMESVGHWHYRMG